MSRRIAFFLDHPCVQCGESRWDRLELDHIDPERKVGHRIWSWSEERRNAELANCQALCRPCHRKKTNEYLKTLYRKPELHGRADTQRFKKGCHCAECDALRAKIRAEKARRRRIAA